MISVPAMLIHANEWTKRSGVNANERQAVSQLKVKMVNRDNRIRNIYKVGVTLYSALKRHRDALKRPHQNRKP